jgi:hypothetical protein
VEYSLRAELMKESVQDYCALKTLEKLTDKQTAQALLDEAGIKHYNEYPRESAEFAKFRNRIYETIEQNI